MSWNSSSKRWISTLFKWVTRRRHPSRTLILGGVPIIAAAVGGGWRFGISGSLGPFGFLGSFSTSEGLPFYWLVIAFLVGLALAFSGAYMSISDWCATRAASERRAVLALELRGLVDTSDKPLLGSVPRDLIGQRIDGVVDVRELAVSGSIEHALAKVLRIPEQLRSLRGSRKPEDVSLVAAGVLQVPLLFIAGVLIDDEGAITPMDWDRTSSKWRRLDEPDDGERFSLAGIEQLHPETSHVVLSVSASYLTNATAIKKTFGDTPVVSLSLPNPLPETLWSDAKQSALASQFVSTIASLGNSGVEQISLILAAPSSLAIRLGRSYDRRNMPKIACYQYDRTASPAYPWAVQIGPTDTQLVKTTSR
ncbi:SAVED domain-containing protein [Silanimonas sp.]|uniref:SAVED domain-containing protein n=1 Tax=Silanimonas sp. TaxID=1929290 RepID=UPI0022BFD9D6|nr:SAVED domain-containing protein [Silanimonas sp.]MCZ8164973.1 SAVED domain-containing protein [Silanimonas sp.]